MNGPKNEMTFSAKIIDQVFSPLKLGKLTIIWPDGLKKIYGLEEDGITAEIRVKNNAFFKKCVLYGDVGFGESYVDGDWETPDIPKVIEWMILNVEHHPTLMADREKNTPVNIFRILNTWAHKFRDNSIKGSRKNISDHYDLSNVFFKTFLDPTMAYSSAHFSYDKQSLQDAQMAKFEMWCRKLKLKSSDYVLEVGCGWGGFAVYAAKNYGCRITAVTISKEQYAYVQNLIENESLNHLVDVQFADYRDLKGQYDKIISIEMIEAVGHKFLPVYFEKLHQLLKRDGLLGLQMILSPDHRYESFLKNVDWIQKHIFPGSLLPSMKAIQSAINHTGTLTLYGFEDITSSYALTLKSWREKFNHNASQVRSLGFDSTFIRKWNYYLSYCESAFQMRNISVAQVVFSRPNNLKLTSLTKGNDHEKTRLFSLSSDVLSYPQLSSAS